MTISEYIRALEQIRNEHGELVVETDHPYGRGNAAWPEIAYRKILKGRESRPEFWWDANELERRGEKVVRI